MKLCENTTVYLKESDNYGVLTDTFKNDGFGSTCNTEAASMLENISKYFHDYALFLDNDREGMNYVDADMSKDYLELANSIDKALDKIKTEWNKYQ